MQITYKEFEITLFNMLNDLMESISTYISRWGVLPQRQKLHKESKRNAGSKKSVSEMKNSFTRLIRRLDTAKERIHDLKIMTVEMI